MNKPMINNAFDKKVILSNLFDQYKELLTKKQREYFDLYMNEDLSLNEIADQYKVSKNAVFDSINKTEKILESFEKKLKLVEKQNQLKELVEQYDHDKNDDVKNIITKIKELIK